MVYGFGFDGYWRDIGTIRAFYETNLELAAHDAPFNFYDPKLPIYTHERFLPGTVVEDSHLTDVLLTEGCRIEKAADHPFGGRAAQPDRPRARASRTRSSMGSDYYSPDHRHWPQLRYRGRHPGQERHASGRAWSSARSRGAPNDDRDGWVVRDGIVVLPKDANIPAGTHIGPGVTSA